MFGSLVVWRWCKCKVFNDVCEVFGMWNVGLCDGSLGVGFGSCLWVRLD